MLNSSSSSLVTCRWISPLGPVVWSLRAGLLRRHSRRELLCCTVCRRQRLDVDHPVEHPVPPALGALEVQRGVQRRRALDQRGQQCAVGDGELLDGFVEVGPRRRRDPVGAPAEVDDVQIGLQHLVFGPLPRHLGGDDEFLGLADQAADAGALGSHQRVLDVLLGDRRTALRVTAEDVVLERAREPGEREARVGVEVAVLGRDHRLADMSPAPGRC